MNTIDYHTFWALNIYVSVQIRYVGYHIYMIVLLVIYVGCY